MESVPAAASSFGKHCNAPPKYYAETSLTSLIAKSLKDLQCVCPVAPTSPTLPTKLLFLTIIHHPKPLTAQFYPCYAAGWRHVFHVTVGGEWPVGKLEVSKKHYNLLLDLLGFTLNPRREKDNAGWYLLLISICSNFLPALPMCPQNAPHQPAGPTWGLVAEAA